MPSRCRLAILTCVCTGALALAALQASPAKSFSGRVVGVSDGDTISVLVGRRTVKVRLEGIDCPELAQPYGRVAKMFTSDRVFGKWVQVEQTTVDRYGRSVGRVFVNGEDVSTAILSAGLGWHYTEFSTDRGLDAAEQAARAAHRGLWSQPNPVPPWVYRRRPSRGSPAPKPSAPVTRAISGPFHGNVQTHVFHAPGCPNYNCRNCTAVFATREEAIARGFKPAGDCNRR
jgi:endonuclease YncB( thermonuclease family)